VGRDDSFSAVNFRWLRLQTFVSGHDFSRATPVQIIRGFESLRENRKRKPQISPLRFAPVEMTKLLRVLELIFHGKRARCTALALSSRQERT
jgi:hypothetical protein